MHLGWVTSFLHRLLCPRIKIGGGEGVESRKAVGTPHSSDCHSPASFPLPASLLLLEPSTQSFLSLQIAFKFLLLPLIYIILIIE